MKTILTLILSAFIATSVFAQEVSVCTEEGVIPCELAIEDAKTAFIDMMLSNTSGLELLKKTGLNGLTLPILEEGILKVTVLSKTQIKYELSLDDCRGTDACAGLYLWTALATVDSDGYTSQTTYENSIQKL